MTCHQLNCLLEEPHLNLVCDSVMVASQVILVSFSSLVPHPRGPKGSRDVPEDQQLHDMIPLQVQKEKEYWRKFVITVQILCWLSGVHQDTISLLYTVLL